jgi:hypothetical protein
MTWEILWALILGFGLSAVVQAVVLVTTIVRLLGDDRPKTLAIASGFGAASSQPTSTGISWLRSDRRPLKQWQVFLRPRK